VIIVNIRIESAYILDSLSCNKLPVHGQRGKFKSFAWR